MIVWTRFATGKCWHAVDQKWAHQRHFITLCSQHKDYPQLSGGRVHDPRHKVWWEDDGRHCSQRDCEVNIARWRKCKTCVRVWKRHQKRSRGLNLDLSVIKPWLEMPRGTYPPSHP